MPLIGGIERRIEVLDDIRHDGFGYLASMEQHYLETSFGNTRSRWSVINLNAVFGFIILALAPGYLGFAISHKDGSVGSIANADF
ncbi:hypothetical protein ACHAQH_001189 [Verticillium albo-atrum]